MNNSFVIGYYGTQFGEFWEMSLKDLVKEAIFGVLKHAKVEAKKIDAIFFGNMLSGILDNDLHFGSTISEILGTNLPVFRMEAACASGGMAFNLAAKYLDSGAGKNVLVIGAEKMTDYSIEDVTTGLASAASEDEQEAGLTFPGLYGLIAQNYLTEFNYDEEVLAHIAVKNHYHGSFNSKGQFRNRITVEQVMKSQYVASPLKVLDCSPISDGASAVILSKDENLIRNAENKIELLASELSTDSISLKDRESLLELKATKKAVKKALNRAGIDKKEITLVELHDCFTIAEILALEDLGFWKKGEGGKEAMKEKTKFDDNQGLVVNTSGGLKASGHPVGATGIKQIGEIFMQLSGIAGQRQVEKNKFGLTHNVGGSGGTAVVNVFKRFQG